MKEYLYSNEIVFRGHPDKVCDQIAATLLCECLSKDENTRAGIEVVGGKGKIFITGEVTTKADLSDEVVKNITKKVLSDVGYDTNYEIINNIGLQSSDIAQGVDVGGAGDQGMMFGYAVTETKEYLPIPIIILQKLSRKYDELRKKDKRFLPDGKAQITGVYGEYQKLLKIKDFVISYQNTEEERDKTDEIIRNMAIEIVSEYGIEIENFHINPTGKFLIGGFEGDSGLTGRKIVVDTYHGFCKIGGGNLNGKDPTKVDFSGHIKARNLAVRFLKQVPEGHYCEVQLSYAIGLARPLAVYVLIDDKDYSYLAADDIYEECKPANMIKDLDLVHFDYVNAASFGFFQK